MERRRGTKRVHQAGLSILMLVFAFGGMPSESEGISIFGVAKESGRVPAAIDFDDLWFYEREGAKQIPDIDVNWVAVAFDKNYLAPDGGSFEAEGSNKERLLESAEEIVQAHAEILDLFYDENLAEDGCFFRLREGLRESDIKSLIRELSARDSVAYAHPALVVRDRTVAFFNAFRMNWKTGVDDAARKSLMEQTHVTVEHPGEIYRVDVLAMPFFRALNLLAEDVRVLDVAPVLLPLEPSIRVELSVPLEGCQIGDRIPFAFRVEFSDRIRIDPSSLVNINLRPGQIQKELFDLKFDPYDYVEKASQSPLVLTGWMKIYSPGEFVIPAVKIHYTCIPCSDDRVRFVETEAIRLKVASIVPSNGGDAKLAVPLDNVSPPLPVEDLRRHSRKSFWQAAAFFVLAAGLFGWSARQWAAMRRERLGELAERREDALEERLRAYLARPPDGPHWEYAAEAGRLLREYLNEKYGLGRDPRQASGAVFLDAVRGQMPRAVASQLGPLLEETDRMIALETAEFPDLERWKQDIVELVERTRSEDP